ncbi:MAG: hypothetical protein D6798_11890 [Deltaproteobacteria bacterium]|nr:MAG: hypothetical protein D6798_11890 [Deltaproteobacteria bacterium]
MTATFLLLGLLWSCGDKGAGTDSAGLGDGGSADGGVADGGGGDGGGGDGGDTGPTPDECDDHAGELICVDDRAVWCDAAGDVQDQQECAADELCQDAWGCLSCAVELDAGIGPHATAPALVRLVDPALPWEERRFSLRPVVVRAAEGLAGVEVVLDVAGGADTAGGAAVSLFDEDGTALGLPVTLPVETLPRTLLLQGEAPAEDVALVAEVGGGCAAEPATLPLRVAPWRELVGRELPDAPWFDRVDAFTFEDGPTVAIDADLHGDLAGRSADLYVVAHRDLADWAEFPLLVDETGGPDRVVITGEGPPGDSWQPFDGPAGVSDGVIADGWDVVLDLDDDGTLSPGDLFEGPGDSSPAMWILGDLTEPGPHEVTTTQYREDVWLGQRLYHPTDIEDIVGAIGPRPLVVISHGNGHDYRWYDYLGEHLASWGYVVMAHENETGPGIETASWTTLNNTEWFLENLDRIADGALVGMVDVHRIAWIGHSRGGEGVVRAYDRLVEGDIPEDTPIEAYTADDIVFISSIAPTVFLGVTDSNPHDRWYHLIAGSADGDVTGAPSSGVVQYLRIAEAATEDLAVTYVHGASHNDFNCCGPSDGTGPDLIGPEAAQDVARSTYLALLEWVVEGNPAPAELITRSFGSFHDGGLDDALTIANQWRPGPSRGRQVLDDFQSNPLPAWSSAGTAVTATVAEVAEDRFDDADAQLTWTGSDPMNGMTLAEDDDDRSRGVVFQWEEDSTWRTEIAPDQRDLRHWTFLSLRACQGTRHPLTDELDAPLSFTAVLIDGAGTEASLPLAPFGQLVTRPYQRGGYGTGTGWSNEWNTLRVRLDAFQAVQPDLDLSDIAAVELRFGPSHGSPMGRLGLDDLMLVGE